MDIEEDSSGVPKLIRRKSVAFLPAGNKRHLFRQNTFIERSSNDVSSTMNPLTSSSPPTPVFRGIKREGSFRLGTTRSIVKPDLKKETTVPSLPPFRPSDFSIVVLGDDCSQYKSMLKQDEYKVFAMDSQKGGEAVSYQDFFTFIQKHASSIHLVVVSSSFEHLRDLIRGMKSNNGELGSVPLMVICRESDDVLIDALLALGVNDCITTNLPMILFKQRVEHHVQLNWLKSITLQEITKRIKAERKYNQISLFTGPRETFESDLTKVSQAFEAPEYVLSRIYGELAPKEEVDMEDYKSTVVNVLSQELEQSPERLKNAPLKNSKFNTLDRKTKNWVLSQFSRVGSGNNSTSTSNESTSSRPLSRPSSAKVHSNSSSSLLSSSGSFNSKKVQFNWTQLTNNTNTSTDTRSYDNTTLSKARQAFSKYDMDSNCVLTLNEIVTALKEQGIEEEYALRLMKALDMDDNGSISFQEFLKGFPKAVEQQHNGDVLDSLSLVDKSPEKNRNANNNNNNNQIPDKEVSGMPNSLSKLFEPPPEPQKTDSSAISFSSSTSSEDVNIDDRYLSPPEYFFSLEHYEQCIADHKDSLSSWEFDLWGCTDDELLLLLFFMFEERGLLELFSIPRDTFINFLFNVRARYRIENDYHNWKHAFDVTHACYMFVTTMDATNLLKHVDIFSLLTAALCHDLDHPGLNNTFQVNAQTPLAILYNDKSVLENHHCHCIFRLVQHPSCNIFASIVPSEMKEIRKIIVEAILQTDMAFHFDLVAKVEARLKKGDPWSKESKEDRQLLVNLLLHSADLSNAVKPWKLSRLWSDRVQNEFLQQGDKEKEYGLPVSMYMDRNNHDQPRMSLGFCDFIVEPLFSSLKNILPKIETICMTHLYFNRQMWTVIEEENRRNQVGEQEDEEEIEDINVSDDEDQDNNNDSNPNSRSSSSASLTQELDTHKLNQPSTGNIKITRDQNGHKFSPTNSKKQLLRSNSIPPLHNHTNNSSNANNHNNNHPFATSSIITLSPLNKKSPNHHHYVVEGAWTEQITNRHFIVPPANNSPPGTRLKSRPPTAGGYYQSNVHKPKSLNRPKHKPQIIIAYSNNNK